MTSHYRREELQRAGLLTCCREWPRDGDRCTRPAEFILWGKLLPPESLGPRCYKHAAKHVGHRALGDPTWAIADLRPLLREAGDG
jgi:hypothetical protein